MLPGPERDSGHGPSTRRKTGHFHLRGSAEVETSEMLLKADEIDYDRKSGDAEARGHVRFEHFTTARRCRPIPGRYNVDDRDRQVL